MADEQLFQQIVGQFNFKEPTEEDLERELDMLTGVKTEKLIHKSVSPSTKASFAAVVVPEDSVTDWNVDNAVLEEKDLNDPELLKDMERLTISNTPPAVTPSSARDELRALAIKAKREGRLEDAKSYLQKLRAVDNVNQESIDGKISQITELAKQSNHGNEETFKLKQKALALKKAGDLQGALYLLKRASEPIVDSSSQLKLKYKSLFDRLARQSKLCEDASKYYTRIKDSKNAKLFMDRKRTADNDCKFLLSELKSGHEPPKYEQAEVSFETQSVDDTVNENDLVLLFDTTKTVLPNPKTDYKLKVILEWPPNGNAMEHERVIPLNSSTVIFDNRINRDIRQQKFFEHRRLKLELILKEKTFFLFTQETIVASGYIRLSPLCTACSLKSEVRLVDNVSKKHSCIINVELKARHPITLKDPVKHEETFIHFNVHGENGYTRNSRAEPEVNDLLVSYVVIEKEIERISCSQDPNAQIRLVELEGLRDQLSLQVQTGQLSMEDYLTRVQECIIATKKKCVELKRSNQLEQAKMLLVNVKLMEDEVREASEQQPEED